MHAKLKMVHEDLGKKESLNQIFHFHVGTVNKFSGFPSLLSDEEVKCPFRCGESISIFHELSQKLRTCLLILLRMLF